MICQDKTSGFLMEMTITSKLTFENFVKISTTDPTPFDANKSLSFLRCRNRYLFQADIFDIVI